MYAYHRYSYKLLEHVNSLYFYQLLTNEVMVVQRNLSHDTARVLIHSYIITRLEFCNAVLEGLTQVKISQLQSILNYAVRVVSNLPKLSQVLNCKREAVLTSGSGSNYVTFKILLHGRASTVGFVLECIR